MNNFLKHYRLKIHTLSPVAVGSGEKIGKKEYIYLPAKKRALVPDIEKMYAESLPQKRVGRELFCAICWTRMPEILESG